MSEEQVLTWFRKNKYKLNIKSSIEIDDWEFPVYLWEVPDFNQTDLYNISEPGTVKYMWQLSEDGEGVYIWTEQFYKDNGHVSDRGTNFLKLVNFNGNTTDLFDASLHEVFDYIGSELGTKGYWEVSESRWESLEGSVCEPGDIQPLIEFLRLRTDLFIHCS